MGRHPRGAVVGRTLVVGTGDHLSASLIDHEIGHAIESFDQMASHRDWQTIMYRCGPIIEIGRYTDLHEWWAEAWALVSTGQLTRLVRALGGHREVAEMVGRTSDTTTGLEVTQR